MSRRAKKQYVDLNNCEDRDSLSDQERAQCWLKSISFSIPQELAIIFTSAYAKLAQVQGTQVKLISSIPEAREQVLFGQLNLVKLFNSKLASYLGTKTKTTTAKDQGPEEKLTNKVRLYANIPIRDRVTKRITDYYRILIGTSFFAEEAPLNLASIAWFLPQSSLIQSFFTSDYIRKPITESVLKAALESDKAAKKIALLEQPELDLVNELIALLVETFDDCLSSICGHSSEQINRETKMRDYYLKPYVRSQIASETGLMQGLLATWTTCNSNHQYRLLGKFLDFTNFVHMEESTSFNAGIEQYYDQTYTFCKNPQQFSHFVNSLKEHVTKLKPAVNSRRISDYLFLIRDPAVHAYRVQVAEHNRKLIGTGTLNFLNKILAQPISHMCEVNVDITTGSNPLKLVGEPFNSSEADSVVEEFGAVMNATAKSVRDWLGGDKNLQASFIKILQESKGEQ